MGQSIWLDNITRELLDSGTLKRYIDDLSVTGLTSNPTIFDHAITRSKSYDSEIRQLVGTGLSGEALFFELAVQDLTRAADLFAPIHERTAGGFEGGAQVGDFTGEARQGACLGLMCSRLRPS